MLRLDNQEVGPEHLTPYGDQILVLPDPLPELSESGRLHLPSTVTGYNPDWFVTRGRAVRVGPQVRDVVPGDIIRFQRYEGKEIILQRERYFIMRAETVWGVEG